MAPIRSPKNKPSRPKIMATQTLKSPETLMKEGFQLHTAGKNDEAVAVCKKILQKVTIGETAESAGLLWIKIAPDDAKGWNMLGQVLTNNNKPGDSAKALSIALRLDPNFIDAYMNQAILQKFCGYLKPARDSYDHALTLDPENKRLRTNRINVLLDMGLWDEAKIDVDWLAEHYPNEAVSLALIGRYYRAIGKPDIALPYLQKALKADPDNITIMINLAGCMGRMMVDDDELYKMWKRTVETIEKAPNRQWHASDHTQLSQFMAIHDKKVRKEGDLIIKAKNLDDIQTSGENIDVTVMDDTRRLYEFKNYFCHTEEWTIYNKEQIFVNMMVTGSENHVGFNDNGYIYVRDSGFPQIHLRGPHILLGGAENYYHWWMDFLPRIGLIQEFPELNDVPIIVLDRLNDNQLETLEKVGVNMDRLVKLPISHTLICDHLIVPSLLGRPMKENGLPHWMKPMVNDWSVNWVREKFADWRTPDPHAPKRIFISRIGTKFRRCINEEEVYAIAQRHGFTTLKNEKMSYRQQMEVYSGAEMVMGPHGAGFANMLFAPNNATAIEMFPKNRAPTFYRELCGQLGQRYVKFDGPITQIQPGMAVDFGDFYIDPQEVDRILGGL